MVRVLVGVAALLFATAWTASAQITTGTVSGNVSDAQGVVPGATVMLINEAQGTKIGPQVTDKDGNYTFAYVASATYTVQVEVQGYKLASRKGVHVAGGDKVAVPNIQLEPGSVTAEVDVKADTTILQAASGERSDVIQSQQLEALPVSNRGFRDLVNLLPGVSPTGGSGQQGRIGGGGQDNVMIDGISVLDTGNNGLMGGGGGSLNLPVDVISEVRLETSGYQAEFGRSSGLQISAVTKSGTNRFHGSLYDIENNSRWNQNSWTNIQNGTQKGRSSSHQRGYTIGGPVGKPGGNNKLFFFYGQQFTPGTAGGNTSNLRLPTSQERMGNFSNTILSNGTPLAINGKTYLYDAQSGLPKSQCNSQTGATAACFGNGSGIIPLNRLYGPSVAWMNSYPLPTCADIGLGLSQASCPTSAGSGNNFVNVNPVQHTLSWTPTVRGDYQITPGLRVSGKATINSARVLPNFGSIPGYTDTLSAFPRVYNISGTVNYSLNPTTFVEATYGFVENRLGSPPVSQYSNRNNVTCAAEAAGSLPLGNTFTPLMSPSAVSNCNLAGLSASLPLGTDGQVMNKGYYEFGGNVDSGSPFLDPTTAAISLPPTLPNGYLVSLNYPGFMNINRIQDFTASVTKVMGRHTAKVGFSLDHSYKAQNQQNGPSFQGALDFSTDTNNPLDTGFNFTNEMVGIYRSLAQNQRFIEGSYLYNGIDSFIQDNWKVNRRLTLDYGLRFVHQGPQYDQFFQDGGFVFNNWSAAAAPKLFQPGCVGGTATCAGNNRQALNPVTGQLLGVGTANLIGASVPNSGDLANGMVQAGHGNVPKTGYNWPAMAFAPRFGAAYDVNGNQKLIVRGNVGIFYDRPEGNSVFSSVANPFPGATPGVAPYNGASSITQQWNTLGSSGSSVAAGPVSLIQVFETNSKLPSDLQWSLGTQMALPWASSLGVAYVGHHGYNLLTAQSCGTCFVDLDAIDLGTTLPAGTVMADGVVANGNGIDKTVPTTAGTGGITIATALPDNLVRPLQGYSGIRMQQARFYRTFHSIQSDFTRRFRNGFSFQVAYTLTLSDNGNVGIVGGQPTLRLVHAGTAEGIAQGLPATATGQFAISTNPISGQAAMEKLFLDQGVDRHVIQTNFVYAIPHWESDNGVGRVLAELTNGWQLSGILRLDSGTPFDLNNPGYGGSGITTISGAQLTGSSDYSPRIVINNRAAMGSGCSSNQFNQLGTPAFYGTTSAPGTLLDANSPIAGPVLGSVGLDSARNVFHNCHNRTLDLSLSRTIRLGGGRQIQIRADAFNAPNAVIWNNSSRTVNLNAYNDQRVRNGQYLADGTVDPTRVTPNTANFGAVTGAAGPRTVQLQIRFIF